MGTISVGIINSDNGHCVTFNGKPIAGMQPDRNGQTGGVLWQGVPVRRIIRTLPPHKGGVLPLELFTEWLAGGERGLSSEAIVQRLTGVPINTGRPEGATETPSDPSDFRRCVELLEQVPEARPHLRLMADVSPAWERITANWDDLENLLAMEMRRPDGKAPQLYARLHQLNRTEGDE